MLFVSSQVVLRAIAPYNGYFDKLIFTRLKLFVDEYNLYFIFSFLHYSAFQIVFYIYFNNTMSDNK